MCVHSSTVSARIIGIAETLALGITADELDGLLVKGWLAPITTVRGVRFIAGDVIKAITRLRDKQKFQRNLDALAEAAGLADVVTGLLGVVEAAGVNH